ncbi:DUF3099 domain-containing protein [Mycetocola saprophilus]|uniref:DUF3099 domain-containing protein n=1 Tax=Mycetocola saprophilus TaxID=76636 RepID=UPI0006900555|nr:DUF3099 domain-containing protein [Mycetocola saprophilus]
MNDSSITTLPRSPEEDRRRRMRQYFIAMAIRMVCLVSLMFVHGWWMLVPILGAVFIPYFAVLVANMPGPAVEGRRESPGGLIPTASMPETVRIPEPAPQPVFAEEAPAEQPTEPEPGTPDSWVIYEHPEETPTPKPETA